MKQPKRERVQWVDSRCIHGWAHKSEIGTAVSRITTIGYVVRETKAMLCMAASFDKTTGCFQGIILIPKVAITNRKALGIS